MATVRLGGAGIPLNLNNAPASNQPVGGVTFTTGRGTNVLTLSASESFILPAGTYLIAPGPYTSLQWLDPVTQIWRTINATNSEGFEAIDSDGANWRLANLTGCPIGALITNAGSGLTNGIGTTATGLTVTASSGSSTWQPVVGGAINSTVTITAAGSGYLYPPILVFDAPPAGGIQASGVCTISAGVINAVTVTNQGAGYVVAPNITLINDPRDTAGTGGILTVNSTLAGSGTMTALYPTNQGTALTAVPTFTFSPASTLAATCVMNFVVTSFTIGSGVSGAGYGNAQPFLVLSQGGIVAGTRASDVAGPITDKGLTIPRMAQIAGTTASTGKLQISGSVVTDAGFGFQAVPNLIPLAGGSGLGTTQGQLTAAVGGITDTSWIQPV
jgi:hypothetical protein